MPSTNNVWKNQKRTVELEVPSGQMCLVKRPDPQQLVALGIIDDVDMLSKVVNMQHVQRVKGKPQSGPAKVDATAISTDPKSIARIMKMADRVVVHAVIEPVVARPVKLNELGEEVPLLESERDEDIIYTDMIDFSDRMFIFQHAAGANTDLETFRKSLEASDDGVATGDQIQSKARRAPRN